MLAAILLCIGAAARAQQAPDPLFQGTELERTPDESGEVEGHLTGDWGGARTELVNHGVEFLFEYTLESLSNLSGGLRTGTAVDGLFLSGIDADLEKLVGWKGGRFYIDSLWFHGPSITNNYTGDLLAVSNIDDYDTLRLYELWIQQNFLDDLVSLKLGQLAADREFAYSDYGGLFVNSTFYVPAVIWDNEPSITYYIATTGARVRVDPCEEFFFQAGAYDGNPDPTAASGTDPSNLNSSGTRISLNDGAFVIMEAVYKLNQKEDSKGLPGTYKAGGWIHTHSFTDVYDQTLTNEGSALAPTADRIHQGNHGIYVMADQMVFREKDDGEEGLGLFGRVGGSPSDRNLIDCYVDGGFNYTGAIPSRDEDIAGIAFACAAISSDIRRAYRDMNAIGEGPFAVPDEEMVLEITYQAVLTPWCKLQPDFQWVFHPGGSNALPDALVAGIRTIIEF